MPRSAPDRGSTTGSRPWADGLAMTAGTALIGWQGARLGAWVVDDAAITFAYARSVDEGLGFVQQAGSPAVEGYSNPTWLALLVVGRALGLFDHRAVLGVPDLVLYPKMLGLACAFGILLAVACTARRIVRLSWAVTGLAGVLLASNLSFVAWMFAGLENPLYALLSTVLASVLACAAARGTLLGRLPVVGSGLLALAAALTRPDGAVLAAACPLLLAVTWRGADLGRRLRAAGLSVAVFLLPYGLFLAWRHSVFGRLVPNTAVAKAQGVPSAGEFATTTGELLTYAGWPAVLAATALFAVALTRGGALQRSLPAVLVPLGLTLCAFGALKRDWMGLYRFATPVWALGIMAMSLTLVAVAERLRGHRRAVLGLTVGCALILSGAGQREPEAEFRAKPTLPMCLIVQRDGVIFNEYADRLDLAHGSVLLPSLGGTLLTSDLKVYDLAGLTEPRIADALAADDIPGLQRYVFDELRPTFVHAVAVWARKTGMLAPRLTAEGYVPLYRTSEGGGDWVRADAVKHPERLKELRAWAARAVPRAYERKLTGCSGPLRPGMRAAGTAGPRNP
ncbi:hypothetical protein [Streptomyces sp. S.PNR 29]|uniref:hypothetical protein n=1 Tax=Streptomyces sp. S.PNR 29 TaxID=2973805 RepID=UPI0025AFF754|nr:hypothetical protein [Streptomyces sp. S.PNR 29]MDN0197191.1 hypothetical protein [Streptomyces sp. S.PNR 29]